ncbi:MAG: bifunctional riboflavin kinase/FAD synthetase [Dehalococcoidia bacterium]|nr:bifunctional riboflavin kinase/FAD synthetase [Dehalococcoidia bacterium]
MTVEQELGQTSPRRQTLLAIGVFDGVHAGHRYLLANLSQRARARGLLSGVVTFDPHPRSVLQPHARVLLLADLNARIECLHELGIELVTVLSFNREVAQLDARNFVSLLAKHLKMRGLMIGPDFTLGRDRQGDASFLHSLGQEMDFSVELLAPFLVDGEVVSSTAIRQALNQGDTSKVQTLMGRRFTIAAHVVSRSKRGRTLGFPTANLDVSPELALPANGVYATITHADDTPFVSVTNIGTRPTFGRGQKTVETHLLDYSGDLYRKKLKVEFVQRLRHEKRFASPQELGVQIGRDIEQARAVIGETK